jgi:hypothetical protein
VKPTPSDTDLTRRTVLKSLAAAPAAAALTWTDAEAAEAVAKHAAHRLAQTAPFQRKFFTDHEWETVRVLVDLIIPRDERSGSATEAGVPEFMDFTLDDQPNRRDPIRGGLAWLDQECTRRFDRNFVGASDAERRQVLDDISWPTKVKPGMSYGISFFNTFRDLTASGFFTSRMGIDDLRYEGNVSVPDWKGCPDEAFTSLGLKPGIE